MFQNAQDFEICSISAVIDNCDTATSFNGISLFFGKLTPTKEHIIVTLGGSGFRPTHGGPCEVSSDDNGTIFNIPIPKVPSNIAIIGQIILQYGDGHCDEETFIKLTYRKSWFSWNHGHHHRTTLHLVSGVMELLINGAKLDLKSAECFDIAKYFICNVVPSCDTHSSSVLLEAQTTEEPTELIDEDNEFMHS